MRNSKYISKKTLIPGAITVVAVGLIIWGLSPAIAVVNQTSNSGAPAYHHSINNCWFSKR